MELWRTIRRLSVAAAAALERLQVAERDAGGAVSEAEMILEGVINLDGTIVPEKT
jgi:hypothetical protein